MEDDHDHVLSYLPIYKAALEDDWESVKHIFEEDPEKLNARITYWSETPLLIAVGTNCSHSFVNQLVEKIVSVNKKYLRTPNCWGNNALHYAAKVGNTTAVRLLVEKDPDIAHVIGFENHFAATLAAKYAQKETLWCLLEVTNDVNLVDSSNTPYSGLEGADLLNLAIADDFFDVALYLVENYPNLVTEKDSTGRTGLQTLAAKPDAFPSGSRMGFRRYHFINSLVPVNLEEVFGYPIKRGYNVLPKAANSSLLLIKALRQVPGIKNIHDMKVMHMRTTRLVEQMCLIVIKTGNHTVAWDILGAAVSTAVKNGVHELVEVCLRIYPGLVFNSNRGSDLFLDAIENRQEKVYNLVHQMTGHKVFAFSQLRNGENALHIAGKSAPPQRLKTVIGAALQMQRELQWFKEVEKHVRPSFRKALNKEGKTPRMIFNEQHEDLVAKGQKWMNDTSSSSTVVAALIITIAFAAAFTVPGGYDDQGMPLFLKDKTFMLFAISDAIALFSSSTSALMFLTTILTSRYADEDFLYALPMRLATGLFSLFVSLAAMMVAFGATLALSLRNEITWIAIPVIVTASIPVTLFALLQLPLLVELVRFTYGPSIFYKQSNKILH